MDIQNHAADPLARVEARLARLEHRLDRLTDALEGLVAMTVDAADAEVRAAQARGIDPDARIGAALELAERLTAPEVAAPLTRLLDRMETLDQATALLEQTPAVLAASIDSIDDIVASLAARGIDPTERLTDLLTLLERASAPDAMAALHALVDRLDALAAAAPLLDYLPGAVAAGVDTFDDLADALTERMDAHPHEVVTRWLDTVVELDEAVRPELVADLKHAGLLAPETLAALNALVGAVGDVSADAVKPVGIFGAMRRLRAPEARVALGWAVAFASAFGSRLPQTSVPARR